MSTVTSAAQGQLAAARSDSSWIVLSLLGGWEEDSSRAAGMRDRAGSGPSLFRSPLASLDRRTSNGLTLGFQLVAPRIAGTYNAAIPQVANDGGMWAGKGTNLSAMGGFVASRGRWLVVFAPEIFASANRPFDGIPDYIVPPSRRPSNPFNSPFHDGPATIDLPFRFGAEQIVRATLGQSSASVTLGSVRAALGTENHWWGPGVRNALLLSSNAQGFPHLALGNARPHSTRAGLFEWRWLVGGLSESEYYDADASNDVRSFSAAAVDWSPVAAPMLHVGLARAVFAPVSGWSRVPFRLLDVLADVGNPNERPAGDSTRKRGRDQLFSVFARLRFPSDGAEAYGEWARSSQPKSLRDLITDPAHSQGYTVGMRWLGALRGNGRYAGALSVEAELTNLEVGASATRRATNSFYVSRAVEQGYTNRGEVIGAGIGPGGSSQWVALDWLSTRWQAGANLNRVRWENDAYFDVIPRIAENLDNAWCQHDVTFAPGARASMATRYGRISALATSGRRYNMFFEHALFCPSTGLGREESTGSLSLTFSVRP